ncbi:MAG: DUF4373 domain-containing protein [candidate division Zixibacteria bacterium]|nr:DUF4373 domain-containing protein [Gammaproteobacteria bacterium]NIX59907.1 DUF4373 domain-containing protein [candidate division Zixibacteria bacterium]
MKWFKHDSDAHRDAKLKRIMMKYGMEGYGLYWHCVELIAGSVDQHNITFELEHDAEIIAHDTGIHYERVQEMMSYMVSLGLFENSAGTITCMKLAKRLDQSMTSSPELRKIIKQLHNNEQLSAPESRQNHDPVMTKSEQNRSEEKRREKKRSVFTPPTVDEVRQYCQERGNNVDPESFIAHYEANGWYRGKTKIKDWKACVITWEKRDKPKQDDYKGAI